MVLICQQCQADFTTPSSIADQEHFSPVCKAQGGLSCSPCQRRSQLLSKIAVAKAYIEELEDEYRRFAAEANIIHDSIQQMPVEISSYIFTLVGFDDSPTPMWGFRAPLIIGGVCKSWRAIAWETPDLWTSLYLRVYPDVVDYTLLNSMVKQRLSRSGSLPLSINLIIDAKFNTSPLSGIKPLLELLRAQTFRWRNLAVEHLPLEYLRCLFVSYKGPSILKRFRLVPFEWVDSEDFSTPILDLSAHRPEYIDNTEFHSTLIRLNMERATSYVDDGSGFSTEKLLALIASAPLLTSCHISSFCFTDENSQHFTEFTHSDVHIMHKNLRILQLLEIPRREAQALERFFSCTTLPSLENLFLSALSGTVQAPARTIVSFIERSGCHLKELVLKELEFEGDLDEDNVIQLLYSTPYLERLEIIRAQFHDAPCVTDRFLSLLARRPQAHEVWSFLPNLRFFIFRGERMFSWSSMEAIFWRANDPYNRFSDPFQETPGSSLAALGSLETVELVLNADLGSSIDGYMEVDLIDEDIAQRFRVLKKPALRVTHALTGNDLISESLFCHQYSSCLP